MNEPRELDPIIATWLDEGPIDLPADTRRAILVGLRTQPRARQMAILRGLPMLPINRVVTAAVLLLVVGGLSVFVLSNGSGGPGARPGPSSSAAPSPSSSPSGSGTSNPRMTQTFTSATFGYSIRYPADWVASPRVSEGPLPGGTADIFEPTGAVGVFRALSAVVPDGVVVDDWIALNLTYSTDAGCAPPRDTLEVVTIDGYAGRLRGFCGEPPATEIEATVVVDNRVYLFTLFQVVEGAAASEDEARALFDAFAATITLNPQDAEGSPRPSSP